MGVKTFAGPDPQDAIRLAQSWGSMANLLPIGGAAVWGNATWAPDDITPSSGGAQGGSNGAVVTIAGQQLDMGATMDLLQSMPSTARFTSQLASFTAASNHNLLEAVVAAANSTDAASTYAAALALGGADNTIASSAAASKPRPLPTTAAAARAGNLLTRRLPGAAAGATLPPTSIICMYGTGRPTERGYNLVRDGLGRLRLDSVSAPAPLLRCHSSAMQP
jgi:hypothetical protein